MNETPANASSAIEAPATEMAEHEVLVVFCTCPYGDEAHRIAAALVNERLAACVNILGGIHSVFRWQGQLETSSEHLLIVKTTRERFPALRERILALHSYDVAEVIALPVVAGAAAYLDWVRAETE